MNLLEAISSFKRGQSMGDKLCGKLNTSGVFSVKSYYKYHYWGGPEEVNTLVRLILKVNAT